MEPPFKLLFETHAFMVRTDRQTDRHTHTQARTHTHRQTRVNVASSLLAPDGPRLGNKQDLAAKSAQRRVLNTI